MLMATDQRVARLEGRVEEHGQMLKDLRETIAHLEQRVDRRFDQVDARFTALEAKMDARFTQVDVRFLALEGKVDRLVEAMSTQSRWTLGLVFTGFVTVVAAVIAK